MRLVVVVAALAWSGCSKKTQDGLPAATEWQSSAGGAMEPGSGAPKPSAVAPQSADPHAGLDIPPARDTSQEPHAGMDMSNPHGGSGVDVSQLGMPPPDPNRKIDPARRVAGIIKVHPHARDRVKANGALFLMVKRPGADGTPIGSPLAVERVTWVKDGMAFELTEANAMVAGTELTGDVVVMARYDQDSDAISKQPGDVTGQLRVKIPADKLVLTLDTIVP